MNETLQKIVKSALDNQRRKESYRDDGGVLRCRACGEPLETFVESMGHTVPVPCGCDRAAEEARKLKEQRDSAEQAALRSPLYDASYNSFTFEKDTSPDCLASKQCRAYVEHWTEMEANSYGLLFSGPLGTGKSYYAAAVVNELRNRGVTALIVTTTRLINAMRAGRDPQAVIDDLNRFRLVALDDLGTEKTTDYAVEQLENFINSRNLKNRPLIVTTNFTRKEMDNPVNISFARIFNRVKEMCCRPVILTGPSRRESLARARAERCKEILGI